jgi:ADP-heptose:LPS heptosyltransferase
VAALASGRPWLLVEGPADEAAAAPLRALPGAVVARNRPLRELGAILARAGLYVGNDSGITHLAAAWGAPTLALFGPTDPAVWAPLGPRVTSLRSRDGRMDGLAVAEVAAAAHAARLPS